ncbi:MAG: Mur ligase family protein [Phycisphaerales bacterium]
MLKDQRIVVMGLGRFGGGLGVTQFLVNQGAKVLVTDLLPAEKLADSLAKLNGVPVEYRLGEHRTTDFAHADLVVVNPAVDPRGNPYIEAAKTAGVPLTTEIGLFIDHCCVGDGRRRTIGITGTAGKSTTTAMIGHILKKGLRDEGTKGPGDEGTEGQRVWVGGNLGGSLLAHVGAIGPDDWIVLELSSFMLETFTDWSPHIAVVTNIGDNHLDRHGTLGAYIKAKRTILHHQRREDRAILGPGLDDWRFCTSAMTVIEDEPLDITLAIPGEHNRLNATLAVAAVEAIGVSRDDAVAALRTFRGLPHRLCLVHEYRGVRCYDDSKCTTPDAAKLAIDCFAPQAGAERSAAPVSSVGRTLRIILGGYDKHADLAPLARYAAERCAGLYTIGVTGDRIADAAGQHIAALQLPCQVYRCGDLDTAVTATLAHAQSGEVILLSPACASWDQFTNYEQRGNRFAELVRQRTATCSAI